jgi:hypothetical protein
MIGRNPEAAGLDEVFGDHSPPPRREGAVGQLRPAAWFDGYPLLGASKRVKAAVYDVDGD